MRPTGRRGRDHRAVVGQSHTAGGEQEHRDTAMRLLEVHGLANLLRVLVKITVEVLLAGVAVFAERLEVRDVVRPAPLLRDNVVDNELHPVIGHGTTTA